MKKSLFWLLALVLSPVAVLVVITPMDSQKQYIFGLLSIGILFLMGFSKRRSVSVIMVVTSLLMSTRYMYFRLTQTLHFNSSIEAILGMGLFLAEVYIWVMLLLNYLQTVWPLKRGIVPLPDDMSKWPTVDIYIPSYNEPLEVVRDTVLAAQCIDYPKDKMKIYLLDDGKRSEFAVFAADVGVGYITRNDNKHAKAGNLNHALTLTQGELICVFDCDHVATRVFLQATVGGFLKDPMLALVQTPHYFYSPDPFERNLSVGRNIPNEGMLFYGPIQQGNDNWNATFFCGSCAVIRREALAQIGYIGEQTPGEHPVGAYFEAHIEQGPILEDEAKTIGIVQGVLGIRWYDCVVTGQASHAGPTPMRLRQDALQVATRIMQEVVAIAGRSEEGRGTVGSVQVWPNSRNVVPGEVTFSIDMRNLSDALVDEMDRQLRAFIAEVERESGLQVALKQVSHYPAAPFDAECQQAIADAAQRLGYPARPIVSGAGHDAVYMSYLAPTGMIFIPCKDGISHNEIEYASPEHVAAGANVLLQVMLQYARPV